MFIYSSLENQLNYTKTQLDKLKKTNVFNATFHIWYQGHFGTINNFRLGRLPSAPVDWSEINAAWGQTALLLSALSRKINLTFDKYKLVPYGNHSYIEVSFFCLKVSFCCKNQHLKINSLDFSGIKKLFMVWEKRWFNHSFIVQDLEKYFARGIFK